jgi:hypothetical protein
MVEERRRLGELCRTDDPLSSVSEAVQFLAQVRGLGGDALTLPTQVAALARQREKLEREQSRIASALPRIFDGADLPAAVSAVISQYEELRADQERISGRLLPTFTGTLAERVAQLLQTLGAGIPSEFQGADVPDRFAHFVRGWNGIVSSIATDFTEGSLRDRIALLRTQRNDLLKEREDLLAQVRHSNLTAAMTELLDSRARLSQIEHLVGSSDSLPSAIGAIVREQRELKDIFRTDDLPGKARQLVEIERHLDRIRSALQCSAGENLVGTAARLRHELRSVQELLGCETEADCAGQIRALQENLESAAGLLLQILSRLSGADRSPVRISFPVSASGQRRLLERVDGFKHDLDAANFTIELVLDKGRSLGYVGRELGECVDFIVAAAVGDEAQTGIERMQRELASVRTLQERERASYIKHKTTFQQRIEEQRGQLGELREAYAAREEELQNELKEEQRIARAAQSDFERERRIHEELIRVIASKPFDTMFLRANLDPAEVYVLHGR